MRSCVVFALLVLGAGCATGFSAPPTGINHYRYQLIERASGQPEKGYRLDYDLVGSPRSVVAIVHGAQEGVGDRWSNVSVDPACAASMHAQNGEIARVT